MFDHQPGKPILFRMSTIVSYTVKSYTVVLSQKKPAFTHETHRTKGEYMQCQRVQLMPACVTKEGKAGTTAFITFTTDMC